MPFTVGKFQGEGPPTHFIKGDGLDWEVMFLALDRPEDVHKLLSLELSDAWINEAREVPKAILDGLTGRVGRFPPIRDGGCTGPQIIMDSNPPDSDHWWYKLAEEDRPEDFEFFSQPSGLAQNAENLINLPPNYYHRAILGKSDDWIKIYVRGEYGFVMDGRPVYPEYRDSLHCKDVELIPGLPINIGLDFGLTPAAAFFQKKPMGQLNVLSELIATRLGAKNFAKEIKLHLADHYSGCRIGSITGDPAGQAASQADEEVTVFSMLASEGVVARPASTNDFTVRREAVAMKLTQIIDGELGLAIHSRCRMLRKGMAGGYHFRRIQVSGTNRFQDKPEKNECSHIAEALQYGVLGTGGGREALVKPEGLQSEKKQIKRQTLSTASRFEGKRQSVLQSRARW